MRSCSHRPADALRICATSPTRRRAAALRRRAAPPINLCFDQHAPTTCKHIDQKHPQVAFFITYLWALALYLYTLLLVHRKG